MIRMFVFLAGLLVCASAVQAQEAVLSRPGVASALQYLKTQEDAHIRKQIEIAEIPAPGWHEEKRAAFVAAEFKRVGLTDVQIDPIGNVLGWRRGRVPNTLVIAAHLDTVFPAGTDVTVKRNGARLSGPGLNDDSRGLVCLLALAEALNHGMVETNRTLLFVANVGEEGLGNLRGTRYLFTESPFRGQLDAFVTIDGLDLSTITNTAIGSRRYRITVTGPGGHSFFNFGIVNPAHALGRIIAHFADTEVPAKPITTYSVGLMGGGTSVNSVPFESWMEVDMRSEGAEALAALESSLRDAVRLGVAEENARRAKSGTTVKADFKLLGDRPVGLTPADSPLVQAFSWATRAAGDTPVLASGSNDSGFPVSLGIPGIAIGGGGRAGDMHSLTEWFEPEGSYKGVQRALLGILAFDLTPVASDRGRLERK